MDLVYGHLGQPAYDTESKTWHFARDAYARRYMHLLCPLVTAKETETSPSFDGDPRQLERIFAGADQQMLHDYLHFSEAVELATSQHDPTVSNLISFGNAVDENVSPMRYPSRHKPVVVVASGAAGELVRLIALNRENLGWKDYKGVKVQALTGQNGLEVWWKGSGGKIQQVTFAGKELKASTVVAVRHQGAISLLNPRIQRNPVCPSNALGRIRDLPPSRLDANHRITITPATTGSLPFADVAFDPWDYRRFVTVDQAGQWQIWIIQPNATWTVTRGLKGSVNEMDGSEIPMPIWDGWAKVLWAVDSNTLIVVSRTAFEIFDLKVDHVDRNEADFHLAKTSDWILDIHKDPTSQRHLLILTSSRLMLVEICNAEKDSTNSDNAVILVSWIHFRAHQDVSLSLFVMEESGRREDPHAEDAIMVTLYSRLNGLASVFAFCHSKVTSQASSIYDPCLLPLPNVGSLPQDPLKARQNERSRNPPVCLNMTTVRVTYENGIERPDIIGHNEFYLLRVLNHDLSYTEHIYLASTAPNLVLKPPDVQKQVKKKKTPAKVTDDFIVPDGIIDDPDSESASDPKTSHTTLSIRERKEQKAVLVPSDTPSDQPLGRSLDMQWLVEKTREKSADSATLPFNDMIEVLQEGINERLQTLKPGVETLLEIGVEAPSVTDIDEAGASLSRLLAEVNSPTSDVPKGHRPIVMSLLPQINDKWNNDEYVDLLQVYESLVKSEITPLPLSIPGRVRLEREKNLRSVAAQVFLASQTISARIDPVVADVMDDDNLSSQNSNFHLPVREKDSAPSSSAGATGAATGILSSSHPSGPDPKQISSQPLSKKSKADDIDREFIEDPSTVYLRNLVSLTPQPSLPPKLSNILSHWRVGEDPAAYDWESSQRVTINLDDEAEEDEQVGQNRKAKKAKKRMRNVTTTENPVDKTFVHTQGESSSQPAVNRITELRSQGAPPVMSSSQMPPEGSQVGESLGISSQPLPGKFAGGKKPKKGRKKGF